MEEENQAFSIHIEEYEKYMDTELARDKKKEIRELLAKYSQFRLKSELFENGELLREAIQNGDIELIKVCLSETIQNETKELTFKINKTNKTASLYKINNRQIKDLIIPRTVKHESEEYLITSICSIGEKILPQLYIKTLKFSEDSSVSTIYQYAFSNSKIEEIYFPKSLKELREGWCFKTNNLKKILISPSNDQFICKDDKYCLGKSDKNSNEFDILLFVNRNVKEMSIPTNIKIISSYAFSFSQIKEISIPPNVSKIGEGAFCGCSNLQKVEIPTNSNLQSIERNAFFKTKICKIFIPPNVTKICESAFFDCSDLRSVEIPTNSNLQTIERSAFCGTNIDEIYFPKNLKELKNKWCCGAKKLKKIIISPSNDQFIFKDDKYLLGKNDKNNGEYDIILFVNRYYDTISIPPNVSKIGEYAFYDCHNLRKVEIPTNSNFQIIERYAFSYSKIFKISIPPNVSKIGEFAFYCCRNLRSVEIPTNSNLQTIERNAFYGTNIEKIFIPPNVTKICESAFSNCSDLRSVEIPTNSNLQTIERNAFSKTNIEKIYIPPNVSKICEDAFHNCPNFQKVVIPTNSNLQTIESDAFSSSKIEEIFIPPNITKIGENAFSDYYILRKIVIPTNSNLQTIEKKCIFKNKNQRNLLPKEFKRIEKRMV